LAYVQKMLTKHFSQTSLGYLYQVSVAVMGFKLREQN